MKTIIAYLLVLLLLTVPGYGEEAEDSLPEITIYQEGTLTINGLEFFSLDKEEQRAALRFVYKAYKKEFHRIDWNTILMHEFSRDLIKCREQLKECEP